MLADAAEKVRRALSRAPAHLTRGTGRALFLLLPILICSFIYIGNVILGREPSLALKPLYQGGGDLFMDFFNSVRDAAQGQGAYTERRVIYPPMANLLFFLFSRLLPTAYTESGFDLRQSWVGYPAAILAVFLFLLLPLLALSLLCYKTSNAPPALRTLLALSVWLLAPLLFLLERGNVLLYALVAVFFFACYYDHPSKAYRECSLLALAFAFSLKLYPALFGWLLLSEKRYADGIRCALYGLLLLLLPSFFFGGPSSILWMIENILFFSKGKTAVNWATRLFPQLPQGAAFAVSSLVLILLILLFLLSPFLLKRKWKILTVGTAALFALPALNELYTWSFFLPPLLLLLSEEMERTDLLYALAIGFPLPLYPLLNTENYMALATVSLLALLFLAAFDTAKGIKSRLLAQKKNKNAQRC